ncbi:hypothetical protein QBC39DRAFT_186761 [Podospora conica]|nr:hypothetical protein QBC39DRAFT_186761 [Schizothecium conicum]
MSAAVALPGDCAVAPQVCGHCQKSFPRLCDLNKHSKSHSRPFKCSVSNCKYYGHGWPTAKELERHVNDKHSASPRTYPCRFASCTYESKRESNCKQHMEKKHGWTYVRSKSNGKRIPNHRPLPSLDSVSGLHANFGTMPEAGSHPSSATMQRGSVSDFDTDFVLFPDDPAHRGDEDHEHGYGASEDDESGVLIPWTSPTTRILKNQSMLDMFSEAYGTASKATPPDCMIDPSLRQHGQIPGYNAMVHGVSGVDRPVKLEPTNFAVDRLSWDGGSGTGSAPADSPSDRRDSSAAYSSQLNTPHDHCLDFSGPPAKPGQMGWLPSKPRRRGSDEDDNRPEKKFKSTTAEEFTDSNMPDIFRFAHPHIYDRDQMEKYSPCHSFHRDISTLVRHLGRPAHRLAVSKDAISSFEIDDPDYPHPRVGICRRCWRTWSDQAQFDQHSAAPCNKVSKGKREKWQVLFDSLTPLVDTSMPQAAPEQPLQAIGTQPEELRRSPSRQSGFFHASLWHDHVSTPSSVPSHADIYLQPLTPSVPAPGHALMPTPEEYMRLQKENEQLKLKLQFVATAQDTHMHGGPSHTPRDSHFAGGPAMSLHLGPLSMDRLVASRPAAVQPPTREEGGQSPERDSLILHMMGSQQPHHNHRGDAAVDVQGLMNEPKETLSRHNSGLSSSSSKSTIHHVSNSPPQRLAEYPDANATEPAQAAKASTTPRNRKPPTSIPDSGYASASNRIRHGSFGDVTHMPGRGHHHHRSSSSLSTVPHPLWSPDMFGVIGGAVVGRQQQRMVPMPPQQQQHEHEQVINTFTQLLEQQQQQTAPQQQSDASFDDHQFFNHQAYYGGDGM